MKTTQPAKWLGFAYFLLPIGLTYSSLELLGAYMQHYAIGVNAAANSGFLVFFIAPILLLGLYAAALIVWRLVRRFVHSTWLAMVLSCSLLMLITVMALLAIVHSYADYPTETPQNINAFLKDYLETLLHHPREI